MEKTIPSTKSSELSAEHEKDFTISEKKDSQNYETPQLNRTELLELISQHLTTHSEDYKNILESRVRRMQLRYSSDEKEKVIFLKRFALDDYSFNAAHLEYKDIQFLRSQAVKLDDYEGNSVSKRSQAGKNFELENFEVFNYYNKSTETSQNVRVGLGPEELFVNDIDYFSVNNDIPLFKFEGTLAQFYSGPSIGAVQFSIKKIEEQTGASIIETKRNVGINEVQFLHIQELFKFSDKDSIIANICVLLRATFPLKYSNEIMLDVFDSQEKLENLLNYFHEKKERILSLTINNYYEDHTIKSLFQKYSVKTNLLRMINKLIFTKKLVEGNHRFFPKTKTSKINNIYFLFNGEDPAIIQNCLKECKEIEKGVDCNFSAIYIAKGRLSTLKNIYLENQIALLNSNNSVLNSNVATLKNENEKLKNDNIALFSRVTTLNDNLTTFKSFVTILENEKKELKNRVTILEGENSTLWNRVSALNYRVTKLQTENQTLHSENQIFKAENQKLHNRLTRVQSEINQLKKMIKSILIIFVSYILYKLIFNN